MIKRSQAAIIEQEIKALSDEALFDGWSYLPAFAGTGSFRIQTEPVFFFLVKNWLREECLRRP